MPDNYACFPVTDCDTKKIRFKTKECVDNCSLKEKIFIEDDINYCIDTCNDIIDSFPEITNLYLTYDDRCVTVCLDNSHLNESNICDCSNLFYIDILKSEKTMSKWGIF